MLRTSTPIPGEIRCKGKARLFSPWST